MDRRTFFAGGFAVTALPSEAIVATDHTNELFRHYLACVKALNDAGFVDDDNPLWDAVSNAEKAVLKARPTTPEGISAQLEYIIHTGLPDGERDDGLDVLMLRSIVSSLLRGLDTA